VQVVVRTGLTVVGGAGAGAEAGASTSAAGSAAGSAGAKAAERQESKAFAAELGPVKPFSVDDLLFLSATQCKRFMLQCGAASLLRESPWQSI
jgi:hypothetical protein